MKKRAQSNQTTGSGRLRRSPLASAAPAAQGTAHASGGAGASARGMRAPNFWAEAMTASASEGATNTSMRCPQLNTYKHRKRERRGAARGRRTFSPARAD